MVYNGEYDRMLMVRKTLIFASLSALFLVLAAGVSAAEPASIIGEGRYFVTSESGIIERLFGARHVFSGGFTTDLTKGELWTLDKIFKIDIRPVPLWQIQNEEETESIAVADPIAVEDNLTILIRRSVPFEAVGWGIKTIYQNEELAEPAGGEQARVAVLDTGIDKDHPDLTRRVAGCIDFTRSSVVAETCEDKNGHGTHLAGIIAADSGEGGEGAWGIAPETNLSIYKVCSNEGFCWADDVAIALRYAADHEIDIATLGFGGPDSSELVLQALEYAQYNNTLVLAPAGNSDEEKSPVQFPANQTSVVAVGALSSSLETPAWSAWGTNDGDGVIEENEIEFAAPGVDIESAWINKEYQTLSGSSQAVAFVAGLAAKLWDGSSTSTRAVLQDLALDLEPEGDDPSTGFGLPVVPAVLEATSQ